MTEQETSAPAPAETAAATAAPATGSSAGVESDWIAALDETTRATAVAKSWKSPADPAKAYLHSQREYQDLKSKALVPPAPGASADDWSAFYNKLGRPEKADGYEFKLPEGLPENLPYDATRAEKFKNWSHKAGLTPTQAQAVHDEFMRDYAEQIGGLQQANTAAATQSHEQIVQAWGDPESEKYQRNQELANRAIRQQGGSELLEEMKKLGALGPNGEVMTPRLAMAFAKIGESLYAEDSLYGGPSGGPNPFDPKTEDLKAQGALVSNDPERARALIRQAGIDPKEYRL